MPAAVLLKSLTSLPARTRMAAGAACALLVVCSIVWLSLARDAGTALFAVPLHPEQLGEVQERLAQWNVPFTASADNVSVSGRRRGELLLRLSLAGVPHAHIDASNEMLSKVSALTPQSVIDEQTRAGLAADLELALRGIDGVQDATVIVAPAKPAVFADDIAHDATASVRLHLRAGTRLSANAVSGIRAFVAAGVPGLDPKGVTILDDRGVALSDDGAGGIDASGVQNALQSALDEAFGAGRTIVRVHVDYDERAQQIVETRRVAASAVPITSEHTDEQYASGTKHYAKTSNADDRGSETRDVRTSIAPGRAARVSVAIAVDAQRAQDIYKIRALAEAAAGLDVRRGDSIAVQAVSFHRVREPRSDLWYGIYGVALSVVPAVATGLMVLLGLKVCVKPGAALLSALVARATIAQTRKTVAGVAPSQVRGALHGEPPHTAAAIISALPAATAAAVLDLYPPEERSAIIRRMSRPHSALIPDFESVIANA